VKKFLFAMFVLLAASQVAFGQSKRKAVPDITGPSEWGTIYQVGSRITITGHEKWDATGEIRPDGESVYLMWIEKGTNKPAPSVYTLIQDNVVIVGRWGWIDDVMIQKDGSITGATMADTLRTPKFKRTED